MSCRSPLVFELKPSLWFQNNLTAGKVWKPQDMGTPAVDCLDEADEGGIIKAIGYYALPNLSIRDIAHDMIHVGHCLTQLRDHQPSYGHWMRKVGGSWGWAGVSMRDQVIA